MEQGNTLGYYHFKNGVSNNGVCKVFSNNVWPIGFTGVSYEDEATTIQNIRWNTENDACKNKALPLRDHVIS